MALKGKTPEVKEKRLKLFLYGPAGVGKTTAAIMFPNAYIIDTERGTDFYAGNIKKSGGAVFQSVNPDEIRDELRALLTEKHQYKTLIIDPVTQLYNAVQEKWNKRFEKHAKNDKESDLGDFGMRYWNKVKSEFKSIQRMILALDMNVIVTSHQKDVYGQNFSKVGVTFDSMKGEDYLYDLVFRLEKRGSKRFAVTEKERAEIGANKFPADFEWSYEAFLKFYGAEVIQREARPVKMATKEQVAQLVKLIDTVKVDEDTIAKWLAKADAQSFDELNDEQITLCINYVQKKLAEVNKNA